MVAGRLQEKVWRTVYIWMPLNFLDINIHVGFAFAPFQNFSTQFPDNSIPSNPSINKSQKFLAIHTFLWYEKKNHIRLKIMASSYIFFCFYVITYVPLPYLQTERKKTRHKSTKKEMAAWATKQPPASENWTWKKKSATTIFSAPITKLNSLLSIPFFYCDVRLVRIR